MPAISLPRPWVVLCSAAAFLLALWIAFLLWGWRLPAATWAKILPGFDLAESAFGPSPAGHIPRVVAIILGLLTAILAGSALLLHYRETLQRAETMVRLCSAAVAVACCCVLFQRMVGGNLEHGGGYDIQTMMTNPASVPVFGQRLLLIWPAMLLKHVVPRLTYIQSFIAIQGVGIVISVYVIGEWSALFVGENLKFLGQVLLTLLVLPTMFAYLAHDVGVIFTYTFCFLFLYRRQYWLFGLAFVAGVLNHQNIVMLVPTAAAVMWGRERASTIAWVAVLSLAVYFLTQYILNRAIPIPQTHEEKVWWNMRQIAELRRTLIFGAILTVPWYAGAAAVFSFADSFLKRASILLPMQLGIYSLYGQLNEPRLFHGFLPILIGIYLCFIRDQFSQRAIPGGTPATPIHATAGLAQ
jgi:hypothetical protein